MRDNSRNQLRQPDIRLLPELSRHLPATQGIMDRLLLKEPLYVKLTHRYCQYSKFRLLFGEIGELHTKLHSSGFNIFNFYTILQPIQGAKHIQTRGY